MKQLDPNHIPSIIDLACKIYQEKRNPTQKEHSLFDDFFKLYMGKAIVDCQNSSKALWRPSKPMSECNFSSKEVIVESKDIVTGSIKFVVATTRSVAFTKEDEKKFSDKSSEKMIEVFGNNDDNDYVIIFNKLIFGKDIDKTNKFINSLFFGILLSKNFFEPSTTT